MTGNKHHDKKQTISKEEHDQLELKCKDYLEGWQRAKADYLNLQKDVSKERESFARYAKTNFIMQVIPLYNNLQTAFEHLPAELATNEWVKGILHIKDQFSELLKDMDIEKIKTKNQHFDAAVHEAVAQESSREHKSGEIIREVAPGYKIDGQVLIAAKVIVAE